jgi:hypothetical protein
MSQELMFDPLDPRTWKAPAAKRSARPKQPPEPFRLSCSFHSCCELATRVVTTFEGATPHSIPFRTVLLCDEHADFRHEINPHVISDHTFTSVRLVGQKPAPRPLRSRGDAS